MTKDRLLSLDIMRGLTVVGMIAVNTAAYLQSLGGYGAYPALLHSEWAGFTVADAVFPAFIFMVGVSIPLALHRNGGKTPLTAALARRIGWRSLRLIAVGLLISNLYFLADPAANAFRPMGVLQRIGVCYGAAALLYLAAGWRVRLAIVLGLLLAYWPLCLLATPTARRSICTGQASTSSPGSTAPCSAPMPSPRERGVSIRRACSPPSPPSASA